MVSYCLLGDTSDIDGQIDIERTYVPTIGQQQFRHPAPDEDQVFPVKAKDIHDLDQDGPACLDRAAAGVGQGGLSG